MVRSILFYALGTFLIVLILSACVRLRTPTSTKVVSVTQNTPMPVARPFMAQVVGLQWLNPLQRRDYPTQWELLWMLGLVKPNSDDEMVKEKPDKYSRLQSIASIAAGNDGSESFDGYHEKYISKLMSLLHDVYYSDPEYFYNVHSAEDK